MHLLQQPVTIAMNFFSLFGITELSFGPHYMKIGEERPSHSRMLRRLHDISYQSYTGTNQKRDSIPLA